MFSEYVRVEIPDDMELIRYKELDSTYVDDERTLKELGAEAIVRTKNGWVAVHGLLDECPSPYEWRDILLKRGWDFDFCKFYSEPKRYKNPKIMYTSPGIFSERRLFSFDCPLKDYILHTENWFLSNDSAIAIRIELPFNVQLRRPQIARNGYYVDSNNNIKLYKLSTMVRTKDGGLVDVTPLIGITMEAKLLENFGWKINTFTRSNKDIMIPPPKEIILDTILPQ